MPTLLEIVKEHDCPCMSFKEDVKIVKFEFNSHWTLFIVKFDIKLYFIDYCPYCGVRLL